MEAENPKITAKQVIQTLYVEFPETILHAELCRAFARVERRSIVKALQGFGRARAQVVKSQPLKNALLNMATSRFPETEIPRLRSCIQRMESALVKSFNVSR